MGDLKMQPRGAYSTGEHAEPFLPGSQGNGRAGRPYGLAVDRRQTAGGR